MSEPSSDAARVSTSGVVRVDWPSPAAGLPRCSGFGRGGACAPMPWPSHQKVAHLKSGASAGLSTSGSLLLLDSSLLLSNAVEKGLSIASPRRALRVDGSPEHAATTSIPASTGLVLAAKQIVGPEGSLRLERVLLIGPRSKVFDVEGPLQGMDYLFIPVDWVRDLATLDLELVRNNAFDFRPSDGFELTNGCPVRLVGELLTLLGADSTDRASSRLNAERISWCIERARRELAQNTPVASVASLVGMSERTLSRTFLRATGLSPKEWQRVNRFERVQASIGLAIASAQRWKSNHWDFGYADQAHMSRDFSSFTGMPPHRFAQLVRQAVRAESDVLSHTHEPRLATGTYA